MGRIDKYYEAQFRGLLQRLGARQMERGVQTLFAAARRLSVTEKIARPAALAHIRARLRRRTACVPAPPGVFLCDAGLGGLARWLRAAGYEAAWRPELDDAGVIRQAQQLGATLLTTDTLMMERGILRDGIVPCLWLPPTISISAQMGIVVREFNLTLRDPRCMACGGELRRVDKASVAERIPLKTKRWLDEYFVCDRCGGLFWHGTHWEKITRRLEQLVGGPFSGAA